MKLLFSTLIDSIPGEHDDIIQSCDLRRAVHPLVRRRPGRHWRRVRRRRIARHKAFNRRLRRRFRTRRSVSLRDVARDDARVEQSTKNVAGKIGNENSAADKSRRFSQTIYLTEYVLSVIIVCGQWPKYLVIITSVVVLVLDNLLLGGHFWFKSGFRPRANPDLVMSF